MADRNVFNSGPDLASESPNDEDARAKLAPATASISQKPSSGSRIDSRVLSGVIGARGLMLHCNFRFLRKRACFS